MQSIRSAPDADQTQAIARSQCTCPVGPLHLCVDCNGNRTSAARSEAKELYDAFIKESIILRLIDEPEASFTDNRLERSLRSSMIERKSNSTSGNKSITPIQVAVEGNAAETLHDSKKQSKLFLIAPVG